MASSFGRGAKGDLISLLQRGLQSLGFYTGRVDGDFGGATEKAVKALQAQSKWPVSGRAGEPEWAGATGLLWPELFARCLQLTARFEGHGYGTVAGNFDGAGLTWGIIGFTLKHGELASILLEVDARAPELLRGAFGDRTDELRSHLRDDSAPKQQAWANAISLPPGKVGVAEPWRRGFMSLGAAPLVQEIQRREARRKYFEPALATAERLGLEGERGVALCFDIHVQNGGVKKKSEEAFAAEVAALPPGSGAVARRLVLSRLVADSSRPEYRADARARKDCVASGSGTVHGEQFMLDAWAFADG